jgi:hypothetical protein
MTRRLCLAASLILIAAGCGDRRQDAGQSAADARAAHAQAGAGMDAAFAAEMDPPAPRPAAETPKPKPAAPSPKPAADTPKPTAVAPIAQGRPAWVDQLPDEAGKLFAVGGAAKGKRDEARRKALQELAASLSVRVQAVSTVDEGELTRIGASGERVGRAWSNFRNEARLSVDRDLSFSRVIAEAADADQHWALAELDRRAWSAALRQEIAQVDNRLIGARDRLAAAGSGLRPAAQAMRVIGPLAARRDVLLADLRLADPQAEAPAAPLDIQALFADCARALAAVTVGIEGAPDAVFAARAKDALARTGLTVLERGGSVTVRLDLRETPIAMPNGWTRIDAAGTATVIEAATGTVAGSMSISARGVDPAQAQARAKMLDQLATALPAEIDRRLIDLLGQ